MKVIKGAGHNIHFEKPDEFANSCLDFLSGK
jgi:pimeloyl-ACP methyl ester carboxylesterase